MNEITKFDVFSIGKVEAVLLAFMGLIMGVIYGVITAIIGVVTGNTTLGILGFFGIIILVPIFYSIFGFIMGILSGLFYNWAAKWVGGIKFELNEKASKKR